MACKNNQSRKLNFDVSSVDIGLFKIDRYEQDLFALDPENIKEELSSLQQKYWVFLVADLNDSTNLNQIKDFITDPDLIRLYQATEAKYPDLGTLRSELASAMQYFRHYFPTETIPNIYTYISGLQYEYPVQMSEDVMIIGLDLYLGTDFDQYRQIGIPEYKIQRMQPEYISIDFMKELTRKLLPVLPGSTDFLDEIIAYGKMMYFLDATLPMKADHLKIGYTPEKLKWCNENEGNLWAFIIDNEILFSSDYQIIRKLISDGPFTAEFSKNSPGNIGGWIGWQIVRSYMKNNPQTSLSALFNNQDAREILNVSKYKPLK